MAFGFTNMDGPARCQPWPRIAVTRIGAGRSRASRFSPGLTGASWKVGLGVTSGSRAGGPGVGVASGWPCSTGVATAGGASEPVPMGASDCPGAPEDPSVADGAPGRPTLARDDRERDDGQRAQDDQQRTAPIGSTQRLEFQFRHVGRTGIGWLRRHAMHP